MSIMFHNLESPLRPHLPRGSPLVSLEFRKTQGLTVRVQTFGGDGKLVQRGHGRIWMTEAGDLFLRYSDSILGVATEAYKALYDYRCVAVTKGLFPRLPS